MRALVPLPLYVAAVIMDNRTMCHLRLKRLQGLAPIIRRLARIAMIALVIAGATLQSSALSGAAEFRTAVTVGENVQPCGGASDCNAGACSAISCFSYIAIESRPLDLGSHGQGSFRLPMSRKAPSLSTAPQPHPPRI